MEILTLTMPNCWISKWTQQCEPSHFLLYFSSPANNNLFTCWTRRSRPASPSSSPPASSSPPRASSSADRTCRAAPSRSASAPPPSPSPAPRTSAASRPPSAAAPPCAPALLGATLKQQKEEKFRRFLSRSARMTNVTTIGNN